MLQPHSCGAWIDYDLVSFVGSVHEQHPFLVIDDNRSGNKYYFYVVVDGVNKLFEGYATEEQASAARVEIVKAVNGR